MGGDLHQIPSRCAGCFTVITTGRSDRLYCSDALDYVDSAGKTWNHLHFVETAAQLWLDLRDLVVHHAGPGPQPTKNLDGTPRRQVHSFLCVFVKPRAPR